MKKIILVIFLFLISSRISLQQVNAENVNNFTQTEIEEIAESDFISDCMSMYENSSDTLNLKVENRELEYITKDEYMLLCKCVQAEAGNQEIDTKVAIAEVILNRIEDKAFKCETIRDVIYAPGQFTVVSNGSINNKPTDETKIAVMIALKYETIDKDVVYFNSIDFFSWATDYKKMGAMYLSKRK